MHWSWLKLVPASRLPNADDQYPNGQNLFYQYNSGVDSRISRLSALSGAESFTYLGLDTVVRRTQGGGATLQYFREAGEPLGDAGDQYTGLDRFGRVVDQRWRNSSGHADRFKYGYDRNGNRLYKENMLDHNFDELYHANSTTAGDNNTAYDGLNRLTDFRRGSLSASLNNGGVFDQVTSASRTQEWGLDALGNWDSLSNNGGAAQTRTHNAQNQISGFDATHDANGNLVHTYLTNGHSYTYDAWNRLRTAFDGHATIAFSYDARGRRITETVEEGTPRVFYYSDQWQVLEEREGTAVKAQYVWSPVYVDALIRRDRDADGSSANGMEERLYVQQDANFNVTSVSNGSGVVQERFIYDPYGSVTVLDANWATDADGQSDFSWIYLHQGGRYDVTSGLYHFRNREYSATLGRWVQQDPHPDGPYVDGMNAYQYVRSSPVTLVDPEGLTSLNDVLNNVPDAPAGWNPSDPSKDDWKHCWVGCMLGALFGTAAGFTQEAIQLVAGGDATWRDVHNTLAGAACAGKEWWWLRTQTSQSCTDCCARKNRCGDLR